MSKTEAFVKNFYGKNVDFIRTLESYQDKNILLRDEDTSQLYVFKRITCDTEHAEDCSKEIYEILSALSKSNKRVPHPYHTTKGLLIMPAGDLEDEGTAVMVNFFQGQTLGELSVAQEELNSVCHQSGMAIAEIDKDLMKIEARSIRNNSSMWNMLNAKMIYPLICEINNSSLQKTCQDVITLFEKDVLSCKSTLRHGLIHGDANDANIIVDFEKGNRREIFVAGVIDFGDMMESKYVFEVATLMAYVMIKTWKDNLNVHEAARCSLKGYESVLPLLPDEKNVLFLSVTMRFVQILCIDSRSAKEQPDNATYIAQDLEACCALLPSLLSLGCSGAWRVWA